jgi:hypothetical protein
VVPLKVDTYIHLCQRCRGQDDPSCKPQHNSGIVFQVLFSDEVCGKEKPFTIVDSRVSESSNKREINVLLLWIDEMRRLHDEGDESVKFVTKLEWITLSEGGNIFVMMIEATYFSVL